LLYLNSDEGDHKQIENIIENIYKHLHKDKLSELNTSYVESELNEMIKISKTVFKKEWKKSKKIFKI